MRSMKREYVVLNRTVVLLALNAMACGAIQASAPASKPSTSVSPNSTDFPSAVAARTDDKPKEDEKTLIKPDARSTTYATVTDERLQHPEAGDWLMYRRTYDGSGFSPLSQITAKNIGNLSLAWSLNTDLVEAHETTPIVNHGPMFITTPGNNVIALDAKTGSQLWRYVKKYPEGLFQLHPTNRGSLCTAIAFTWPPRIADSWRWMPPRAGKPGPFRSMTTRPAATQRWRRWLREARSSSATPVGNLASGAR